MSRVVRLWMGMYYNLSRIRKWTASSGRTPTVGESLSYLAEQKFRAGDKLEYWKLSGVYRALERRHCDLTIKCLEDGWAAAFNTPTIDFSPPKQVFSLVDFPRFYGASWPHNDIAVYVPDSHQVAVMKLADSRFIPLKERLSAAVKGVDPFIGTTFFLQHAKLFSGFNRIRCSKAEPLSPASFKQLDSFKQLLESLSGSLRSSGYAARLSAGTAPLDLTRCIIARYSNHYALMEFVTMDARLESLVKHEDWNYSFKLNLGGQEVQGWMFRDSLFLNSAVKPKNLEGKTARFAGFMVLGQSALRDYRVSFHIISVHPSCDLAEATANDPQTANLPSILSIEDELDRYRRELLQHKGHEEATKLPPSQKLQPKPAFIWVEESKLDPVPGRALVILQSDRERIFKTKELLFRLNQEGIRVGSDDMTRQLEALVGQDLIYRDVFGDGWFLNPKVKVKPAEKAAPIAAVHGHVIKFLRANEPRRMPLSSIVRYVCSTDSRVKPYQVTEAVKQLSRDRQILQERQKWRVNPHPPRSGSQEKKKLVATPRETSGELGELEIENLPKMASAHKTGYIMVAEGKKTKLIGVRNYSESAAVLSSLINEVRSGRKQSLEFTDQADGSVKLWLEKGVLKGTYRNKNPDLFKAMMVGLRSAS